MDMPLRFVFFYLWFFNDIFFKKIYLFVFILFYLKFFKKNFCRLQLVFIMRIFLFWAFHVIFHDVCIIYDVLLLCIILAFFFIIYFCIFFLFNFYSTTPAKINNNLKHIRDIKEKYVFPFSLPPLSPLLSSLPLLSPFMPQTRT